MKNHEPEKINNVDRLMKELSKINKRDYNDNEDKKLIEVKTKPSKVKKVNLKPKRLGNNRNLPF